jgi:hypothetical protein
MASIKKKATRKQNKRCHKKITKDKGGFKSRLRLHNIHPQPFVEKNLQNLMGDEERPLSRIYNRSNKSKIKTNG